MSFETLGLSPAVLQAVKDAGYENATDVQAQAIPAAIANKDLMVSSRTGSGKTAAFILPALEKILAARGDNTKRREKGVIYGPRVLVLAPTRELAMQVAKAAQTYGRHIPGLKVATVLGGMPYPLQIRQLTGPLDILIATPGRLLDHLASGKCVLSNVEMLVLDEADRMLDMGFHDDIMKIISFLPKERQNLLFSATMPMKMREMARKILHQPEEINIAISKPPEKILQQAYVVYEAQKIPLIKDILTHKDFQSVIVFCSKKQNVKQLTRELKRARLSVEEIHSDLEQQQREQVLQDFRNKKLKILVATDILSRGIDIEDIDLVINFDVPNDGEDYVHRIGRTARAASEGTAYTLISEREQNKFAQIESLIERQVEKAVVPEVFGPVPAYQPRQGRPLHHKKRRFHGPPRHKKN